MSTERIKREDRPAVALESTIYAFGFPYPKSVELGWKLARTVHATGAEAKTIAVIDGEVCIGLTDGELDRIARGEGVEKLAAADLGPAVALAKTGATTVSATSVLAARTGIQVFATGGIGGVHREVLETFDESQDLWSLANVPVAVVSAGAKAILDLPRTLERLESHAVPVIGYGTDAFPAFYTRDSGLRVPHRIDDIDTLARAIRMHWRIHPGRGVLVCNPIPEEAALDPDQVRDAIAKAQERAVKEGIRGKALTPFLLDQMDKITEGRSVDDNEALAENNARVAGELAVALKHYADMEKEGV
jgi:pseudouridine-5'-phosphate glycosidase